jgi:hypothetical protein
MKKIKLPLFFQQSGKYLNKMARSLFSAYFLGLDK